MRLNNRLRRVFLFGDIVRTTIVIILVSVSLVWIVQSQRDNAINSLNEALLQEVESKTGTLLITLSKNLYDPIYYFNFVEIDRLLKQFAKNSETRLILLTDQDFNVIHNGNEPVMGGSISDYGLAIKFPEKNIDIVRHEKHIEFYVAIKNDAGVAGYVVADVSLGALSKYRNQIKKDFNKSLVQGIQVITGLVAVTLIFLTLINKYLRSILQRHLVSPILKLSNVAKDLGEGNLDQSVIFNGDEEITQLANSLEQMRARLLSSLQKERRMAYFDSVTDLPNRFAFQEKLKTLVDQNKIFTLMFYDLDDFKLINDTLGHAVGDGLLTAFGNRVVSRLLKHHHLEQPFYRLGGDEFVLILEGINQIKELKEIGNTCVDLVRDPFEIESHLCTVGVSIGVAIFPEHGKNAESIMKHADIAMYRAKKRGKNQVALFIENGGEVDCK